MDPDEIARRCLADELSPLNAALNLFEAFQPFSRSAVLNGLGRFEGPLRPVLDAIRAADDVFYLGDDPDWWHPTVRETQRVKREDAERRAERPMKEACRAILEFVAM